MNCQLTFLFQLQNISSSDSVSILGNLQGLGAWSDPLQHQLTPYLSGINSPHIVINDYFISKKPLIVPQFTSFQYKLVVLSNNKIKY